MNCKSCGQEVNPDEAEEFSGRHASCDETEREIREEIEREEAGVGQGEDGDD